MAGRLVVALVVLLARAAAADVTVRASIDPPDIQVGESAALAIEVDGAQDAPVPEVPAVEGLTLRYLGPSTQVSIVNGRMSQSVTHRFSVAAARPGTFTIGPSSVTVGGSRHEVAAVTLRVVGAGAPRTATAPLAGGDQLRLVLSAAKAEVFLHERVPLRLELWVGNVRVSNLQYPAIPGDGVAIEKLPQEPAQRREGGFQVLAFTTSLTPLRAGTLTVGPATMNLGLVVRSRSRDPFFGFFGETQKPMELRSEPVTLVVLPLPDAGRPPDFAGAVGHFEMETKAAPLALGVGDPVTVTTTIRGNGDLASMAPPSIAPSDTLRVYPVQPSGQPAPGQRTFEQVVIPLRAGNIALPELRFSYFDPEARGYRTISEPAVMLSVHPAAGQATGSQVVGASGPRRAPEKLGRDLVFIKDDPGPLVPIGARRYRSAPFWAWLLVPLAAWLGAVLLDRRRRRLTGDVRYARFTRAGRAARRAIAAARDKLGTGDRAAFYDLVARAMTEYLAAKLDLPPGGVTLDAVADRLGQNGVPPAVAHEVEAFFAVCERARFAPTADASGDMERTLDRAAGILRALERARRLSRSVAAACLLVAVAVRAWAAAPAESPQAIFFRANALYTEERYAEAAAEYERILAGGVASANVYFNLGNAYFKAGDVGRAILDYERARRMIPGDPDLLANLTYARSLTEAADEPPLWARLVFPLAERLSTDRLLLVASGLYTLLMVALIVARSSASFARGARVAAAIVAVSLALVVPSLGYRMATVDLPARAVVVAREDTPVRFEPSAGGTEHFRAKPGTVLRLAGEREGWAQVVRADGRRGWIARDAIAPLGP